MIAQPRDAAAGTLSSQPPPRYRKSVNEDFSPEVLDRSLTVLVSGHTSALARRLRAPEGSPSEDRSFWPGWSGAGTNICDMRTGPQPLRSETSGSKHITQGPRAGYLMYQRTMQGPLRAQSGLAPASIEVARSQPLTLIPQPGGGFMSDVPF